ncbi:MAG: threonine--tRNA ligase [Candidatus Aenigmarchaeota archaeon]|nr:threonine--tRNA ligase [Candidatus Aenigmarchaeota archaeon]
MRILQTHADFIEYEPIQKEIERAEDVERKKYMQENVLILFTSVEDGDDEAVAKKAIDDVKDFLQKIKINKILIYPFAHLSRNLAKPGAALKILENMENYAKSLDIDTSRAPFGWNKQFNLKTKAHPLAEQSRAYVAGETKEKVEQKVQIKKPKVREEELGENDHRVIGKQLDLFSFQEVGPGMVFYHHKGMLLRNTLIDFWRKEHLKGGYLEINTPTLLNKKIWEISGHSEHYKDLMFFTEVEDVDFALKPMNCPGAILVFKNTNRSYKDLPLRLAELGLVSRNELSGVLSGLFRMRVFTQDDAHIFATPEQLVVEIDKVVDIVDYFYKVFGFEYHVELSTKPEKSMGSKDIWDKAESALKKALEKKKIKFKINAGEGAFYGPKIDFHIKDSLGRTWQCATVQVDFMQPERFDLGYVGEDGKLHKPVIIHRVVYGSIERFLGILVEHFKGKFPVWLSPVQARVLPISNDNLKYAENVFGILKENYIRAEIDKASSTIEHKIRDAQLQKLPYMLVVGKKEEANKTIAVRTIDGKTKYGVKLEELIKQVQDENKRFK